jgi:hypothetical protein
MGELPVKVGFLLKVYHEECVQWVLIQVDVSIYDYY